VSGVEIFGLAESAITSAREKGLTISTAESCTGGWIGKALTDIAGSSTVFKGSLVTYANEVKEQLLGVPLDLLMDHGAVSEPVALEMAKNCAQSFGTDIAISVTGIAGPGGGTAEKPVGLVFMALYINDTLTPYKFEFENTGRDGVRRCAVVEALKIILHANAAKVFEK